MRKPERKQDERRMMVLVLRIEYWAMAMNIEMAKEEERDTMFSFGT